MLNLDPGKLLVIGVVAIILLGPDRLPQVARQIGGAWKTFNEFRHRMETQVRRLKSKIPAQGEVRGLMISDAQWGRMIIMRSQQKTEAEKMPAQMQFF